MVGQASGPSGFDWLGAVWTGSEERGQVTLDSQVQDAKSLSIATQLQALLGGSGENFAHKGCPQLNFFTGNNSIQWLIGKMSGITSSNSNEISVVNAMVANAQQEQSFNTQTAGQGVQMSTNQVTQVDTTNQTNVIQLLGALVSQQNQWGGFQLN